MCDVASIQYLVSGRTQSGHWDRKTFGESKAAREHAKTLKDAKTTYLVRHRIDGRQVSKSFARKVDAENYAASEQVNKGWLIDFMSDALWNGRRFRAFNVIDDFSSEALAIEIAINLPAARVRRATVGCASADSENRKDTVATGHRQVMALPCDFACAIQPGCFLSLPVRPRSPMLGEADQGIHDVWRQSALPTAVPHAWLRHERRDYEKPRLQSC